MGKKAKCQAYVVFRGRKPGVYFTWDECKAQVDGFPGNSQHGFATLKEAEARWQEHLGQSDMDLSQHATSSTHDQPSRTSGKRTAAHIDLTGSDDENPRAAKRVQHAAQGLNTRDFPPLGASVQNAGRITSDGPGAYRPHVTKIPIKTGAYVPQISRRPPPVGPGQWQDAYSKTTPIASPSSRFENYIPLDTMLVGSEEQVVIEEDPNIVLTEEQEAVVSLALAGKNLFLTGAGGSGKTVTLKTILARLKKRKTEYQVVAPTGIAALPLNGKTAFSFFGWKPDTFKRSIKDITNDHKPWIEKQVEKIQVLIIEEISMVENQFLERMNLMMQSVFDNDQPFGGRQVIFLGDFHQLPPVKPFEYCLQCGGKMTKVKTEESDITCKKCDISFREGQKWAFNASVWRQLELRHVQLQQIHRQKDKLFQDILYKIRNGIMLSIDEWRVLESKKELPQGICAVRLMSMRRDVDALNTRELNVLKSPPKSWDAHDTYRPRFDGPQKDRTPWVEEKPLENHRFGRILTLKIGAKVVLLTNLDPQSGLVNGSQGEVLGFEPDQDGEDGPSITYSEEDIEDKPKTKKGGKKWVVKTRSAPIVRFANGVTRTIFATDVASRFGKSPLYQYVGTRAQVPLALAWALTIHKSQGMTLSYIEVLSRDIFERGQFYVALSRGTSLAGLTVTGYTREQLPVDGDVVKFYEETKWECFAPRYEAPGGGTEYRKDIQDIIEISSDLEDGIYG